MKHFLDRDVLLEGWRATLAPTVQDPWDESSHSGPRLHREWLEQSPLSVVKTFRPLSKVLNKNKTKLCKINTLANRGKVLISKLGESHLKIYANFFSLQKVVTMTSQQFYSEHSETLLLLI